MRLPNIDPLKKLAPTIKLIGKSIVLSINKFTLFLVALFCIPIIKNKKKQVLNAKPKINFR